MSIESNQIERRYSQLCAALADAPPNQELSSTTISSAIDFARVALKAVRGELAVALLERLVGLAPAAADARQLLGFAYGEAQRIPEAAAAFSRAAELDPREPRIAMAHAQATLDAGFPAAALFEHAHSLAPDNLAAVSGWAASLTAQGRAGDAESLLADTLTRHPNWLAGHQRLASLRFSAGDSQNFARSFATACRAQPQNLQLRVAWFSAIAQAQHWDAALRIVSEGEQLIGKSPAFAVARTFVAGESGDRALAEQLFSRTAAMQDDVLDIAHLRHCLRSAQLEKAESLAHSLMKRPSAHMIWPYLSLIWRLRGDARALWLDGASAYIRSFDLEYSAAELSELAAALGRIHSAPAPYVEQSVRGGTQTDSDRQLFFRAEPEIQTVRARVSAAIREYIADLPAHAPGHPLLGVERGRIRFSGSWSVRLQSRGFHVSHTHPMGWISSALYVSLPAPSQLGAAPAGWISLGTPPRALGFDLPPYARVEPKPARLVLFPSTMWHETLPFDEGERLVIAFDVMKPKSLD
jgi:tetratricopeptide (TPR) repeat protein